MASGMNLDLRADTDATMETAPIVIARRFLDAGTLAEGALIQIPIPPVHLPSTYDSMGLFFDLVSEAATSLAIIAWVGEAGESTDAITYAAL
jgi:hypothetical protein